jgi:tetratricopeptide (TPR) repeat protein
MGIAYSCLRIWNEATRYLKGSQVVHSSKVCLRYLAIACIKLGDHDGVIEAFSVAKTLSGGGDGWWRHVVPLVHMAKGNLNAAATMGGFFGTMRALAETYVGLSQQARNYDELIELFEKSVEVRRSEWWMWQLLGGAYRENGDFQN